ncbi:M48 family metallopeptidase [Gemella cuniculi]|uniref:M48 family metallopeptidase n=1 Tax=Gemella cuniculi TaxID=150240 RepID=UPI0004003407|nr:SprT family zinc-dependent metalloprotease [Gemella cuniculi]
MKKIIKVKDLDITIKYRKNMKNIYLKVEKNGDVVVSAPLRTQNYIIKKLVFDNILEIKKRRSNILNTIPKKREYKTGEKYFIFGEEKELVILKSNKDYFLVKDNKILLGTRNPMQDLEKIFRKNLREILYNKSLDFVKKYEVLMNIRVEELRIKKMKTRWGTCNTIKKRIWINEELIKYPIECLEHIVVHELTHLLETNHTKRFYSLLETYFPTS